MNTEEITWEQFAAELFEYELCEECHGDVEDHEPWVDMFGNWFAHCLKAAEA